MLMKDRDYAIDKYFLIIKIKKEKNSQEYYKCRKGKIVKF